MMFAATHAVLVVAIMALLGAAALHDVAFRTIPNSLTACVAGLALALRAIEHQLAAALLVSLLVLALCTVCWLRGWLGGGDTKLLPAAALAVAPDHVATYVLVVTIAGGVLALLYLAAGIVLARARSSRAAGALSPRAAGALSPRAAGARRPSRLLPRVLRAERWRILHRRSIPYACAIAAGALTTLVQA